MNNQILSTKFIPLKDSRKRVLSLLPSRKQTKLTAPELLLIHECNIERRYLRTKVNIFRLNLTRTRIEKDS